MTDQPPPSPVAEGWVTTVINFLKNLTFTNVVVIVILVIALIPAYFVYRVLNDEAMLYRFLSSYAEVPNPVPGSNCTLREISMRGGGDVFGITTSFATLGSDKWQIGVGITHRPTETDIATYCEVLNLIIDKMRDPEKPTPVFPGTNEPLIWPYPSNSR